MKIFNINSKKWKIKYFKFNFDEIYYTQLSNFMKKLNRKKSNICDEDEAYHTMQIIEAIRKSSKRSNKLVLV